MLAITIHGKNYYLLIINKMYRILIILILWLSFVFSEMIHVALAYYQAKGNFVISSKQILIRTLFYGLGAWIIVNNGF